MNIPKFKNPKILGLKIGKPNRDEMPISWVFRSDLLESYPVNLPKNQKDFQVKDNYIIDNRYDERLFFQVFDIRNEKFEDLHKMLSTAIIGHEFLISVDSNHQIIAISNKNLKGISDTSFYVKRAIEVMDYLRFRIKQNR